MAKNFKSGYEEIDFMRKELKRLIPTEPILQNLKNHFVSMGIERSKVDVLVIQAHKDFEVKQKLMTQGKKYYKISVLFLVLFAVGVVSWFYIWGDWITYFAGANLIAFLFLLQQGSSFRSKAEMYD